MRARFCAESDDRVTTTDFADADLPFTGVTPWECDQESDPLGPVTLMRLPLMSTLTPEGNRDRFFLRVTSLPLKSTGLPSPCHSGSLMGRTNQLAADLLFAALSIRSRRRGSWKAAAIPEPLSTLGISFTPTYFRQPTLLSRRMRVRPARRAAVFMVTRSELRPAARESSRRPTDSLRP